MLFTVPFDDFGGLDLTSAANETGGCIDCLNVALDRPGRVRSRDGYAQVVTGLSATASVSTLLMPLVKAATATTTPSYDVYGVYSAAGPVGQLFNALTGATIGAGTARTPNQTSFTQFGTPSTDLLYIAGDASRGATTSRGTLQKFDGTTLSNSVGKPFYVATTPTDNRLVQAGFDTTADPSGGVNASQSTVFFSDAGVPDTFSANNYVHLHPGDGERITGACVWRNFLIVTKETRMFVFFGDSIDSSGNPVFNYRTVSLPGRVPEMLSRAIVAGDDAFYLLTNNGVYASTGGTPVRISEAIDPALYGPVPATWTDYTTLPTLRGMSYANKQLWIHITGDNGVRSFILDLKTSQWTYSSIGSHVLANATANGVYFASGGTIYQTSQTATTDAGSAITSRFRAAFVPLDWRGRNLRSGIHGVDKTIRESTVEGTGTVSYALTNQWATTIPTAASLTLGTSPAVAEARDRRSVRGRMFSFQLSGTSPWEVQTVSWNIYSYQAAGEQSEAA